MANLLITEIPTTQEFESILKKNPGIFIVKFGAEWCKPCKKVDPLVKLRINELMFNSPPLIQPKIQCAIIDIDANLEVYSFLKKKKMVNGIPAILCWYQGNVNYIPDDVVLGSDANQVDLFFHRCYNKIK
jgi:thiol-disulfide isomerase/thioredoxin